MAKGKFSQPRTHRREDFEIEQAFRQVTGRAEMPEPQDPVPLEPDAESIDQAPEAESFPQIPETEELFYEEEPEETKDSFVDTMLDFFSKNKKVALVSLCAVALVLIVGIISVFFLSSATDPYGGKILNNVTVAGVNVGGMTRKEAEAAVKRAAAQTLAQEDMVIDLAGTILSLSPADTGVKLDVEAAVDAAYDYGRTGTQEERQKAYDASLTGNHTVGLLPYLTLSEEYIRSVLNGYAEDTASTLTQASYEIEGNMPALEAEAFDESAPCQTLVLTMGTPGISFDVDAVYEQIMDAYSLCSFLVKVTDVDPVEAPDPVDLEAIYQEVYVEPVDASVDMQSYEVVPGVYGYGFDLDAAQKQVDMADYGEEIRITMEYIAPEILDDDVFFRDVLGSCETPHTDNENRNTNLRLACAALDGLVLMPGEEFSYNDTLGERTAEKGYKPASAYSGLRTIDVVGGGVCQGSSTLYYCTLLADLEIVDRVNHGFVSSYIDYGMDATVSWGGPDFKFKNNTNFPIKIEAEVSDGYVKMKILGTDERDYYVEMSYVISNTKERETKYETYGPGEGYYNGQVLQNGKDGYLVKTFKSKYNKETGELISKDFEAYSSYLTVDRVVAKVVDNTPAATTPPTGATTPSTGGSESSGGSTNSGNTGSDSGDTGSSGDSGNTGSGGDNGSTGSGGDNGNTGSGGDSGDTPPADT